ncbi:hypothetical protein MSL71_4520 [Desulfoluna butyratoxydans]|uniref:Uncharacterized protein n=1 Tax=Desulfoluna butyratoxydans TaxID=231438 RepID=A0A4U8YH40_9BACT|nr:hypothetical protein MSL71_4520 [Desulfoluna butyratoxydans]
MEINKGRTERLFRSHAARLTDRRRHRRTGRNLRMSSFIVSESLTSCLIRNTNQIERENR